MALKRDLELWLKNYFLADGFRGQWQFNQRRQQPIDSIHPE